MFELVPLCLSTLFHPIKYSDNKYSWQSEAKELYLNGGDNCIYSYVVKTGHGKTRFYCECAINSTKPFSYIFIKWDETVENFIKTIKELVPKSTINISHKRITFKINENKTIVVEKTEQEYEKFYEQIISKCDCDLIFDEFHELHVKLGLDKYSSHKGYSEDCRNTQIKNIYAKNFLTILDLIYLKGGSFRNNKVIFGSATMDNEIVQKMSIYAGLIKMKHVYCVPDESLIEKIYIDYKVNKNPENYTISEINKIYSEFKSDNKKINIYCSTHIICKKIYKSLMKKYRDDIYYSGRDDHFKPEKLKTINIFSGKCTTGVNDESIERLFILRCMKNNNTVNDEFKSFSNLCIQTIGRIRISGKVTFVNGNGIVYDINKYCDGIIRPFKHLDSDYAKSLYTFMEKVNKYRINYDYNYDLKSYITWFMIPQLLNQCITLLYKKNNPLENNSGAKEFLQALKSIMMESYFNRHKIDSNDLVEVFLKISDNIPEYIQNVDNIVNLYFRLSNDYINEQIIEHEARCGKSDFVNRSGNKEYYDKFKKEILKGRYEYPFVKLKFLREERPYENHIRLTEPLREECPQELKELLRLRCVDECELSHECMGFESLDICRIVEGCNGGHYNEDNCLGLSPNIHRIFDNGYVLYTIHNNKLEFKFNEGKQVQDKVKYYYENICKKLKLECLDKKMLNNFEIRLKQELSHSR